MYIEWKVFKGVPVSDFYSGYDPNDAQKQKYNAYMIQDLKYIILAEPQSAAYTQAIIIMLLDAEKLADYH